MLSQRRPTSPSDVQQPIQTPLQAWRELIAHGGFGFDAAQERVMFELQEVYDELLTRPGPAPRRRGQWLASWRGPSSWPAVQGIYLWGGVGRGKTHLVDLFHECLPFPEKQRLHFHRFMEMVHTRLKPLRDQQDPLALVAADIAAATRVVCFDEFYVTDIGDAMILAAMLGALFERGVTLIATSNSAPDDLYKGGLQRDRFVPAIELLKEHTRVMEITSDTDYRLRALDQADIYYVADGGEGDERLAATFRRLAGEGAAGHVLQILGRPFTSRRCGEGVAWFAFDELCAKPRSQNDYIELARLHHTLLVSDVPVMDEYAEDQARRFILLIDELYDRNVNLALSACAPPAGLYRGKRLREMFARTHSRLLEMQSREYLGRGHKS